MNGAGASGTPNRSDAKNPARLPRTQADGEPAPKKPKTGNNQAAKSKKDQPVDPTTLKQYVADSVDQARSYFFKPI